MAEDTQEAQGPQEIVLIDPEGSICDPQNIGGRLVILGINDDSINTEGFLPDPGVVPEGCDVRDGRNVLSAQTGKYGVVIQLNPNRQSNNEDDQEDPRATGRHSIIRAIPLSLPKSNTQKNQGNRAASAKTGEYGVVKVPGVSKQPVPLPKSNTQENQGDKAASAQTGNYTVVKRSKPHKVNQESIGSIANSICSDLSGNTLARKKTAKLIIKLAAKISNSEKRSRKPSGSEKANQQLLINIKRLIKVFTVSIFEEDGYEHITPSDKWAYFTRLLQTTDSTTLRRDICRQICAQFIIKSIEEESKELYPYQKDIMLRLTGKVTGLAHYAITKKDDVRTFVDIYREIHQTILKPLTIKGKEIHDLKDKFSCLDRLSAEGIKIVVISADLS